MAKSGDSRKLRLGQPKARLVDTIEALERRLAAAEARGAALADAIEYIPEGFALFDAGQRMVVCNGAYKALFGYSDRDAAPGRSFDALMRLDVRRKTVAGGDSYPRRRRRDWRRAEAASANIEFGDGRWIQVRDRKTADGGRVSIHADITALKRTEVALRLSQERLQNLVDTAPDAIVSLDEAGKVVTWNRRAARMFGRDVRDMMGKTLAAVIPGRHRGDHAKGIARASAGGKSRLIGKTVELVARRRNGEEFPIELSLSAADHEGKRLYTGIIRDVSELRRIEQALRESERRFQRIAANVPGVVYQRVLRPNGRLDFTYVSAGLRETHGIDPEAVKRDPALWLAATHPDDRDRLVESNARSVKNLTDWSLEYRIIARDGTIRWLRGTSHVRRADDGDVVWDGILLDITEERLAQQRIADVARFPSENPNPVFRVASDGKLLYANDAARNVDGLLVGRGKSRLSRKLAPVLAQASRERRARTVVFMGAERLFSLVFTPVEGQSYVNVYGRDTTEENHAKREMAAAESLLRDAIDNISDGFVIYDSHDRLVTCNQIWKDFYGYSDAEAAPGALYADLVRLDIAKGAISGDGDLRDTYEDMRVAYRKVKQGAFETKLADGRWILIHERGTADGGRVGIQTDVTDLKRAQEALRESEERYALAVEGANDGLWDWNVVNGEIYVSPQTKEILGLEIEGDVTTAEQWNARVHPDDLKHLKDREQVHLGGGSTLFTDEYRVLGADGEYRWVLDLGTCLRDDTGRPYRMAGSLGDITERKRGEQFLRTVVDTMPVALNIRDTAGRYVLTNRRLAAYYQLDPDDTIGKFPHEVYPRSETDEREEREFHRVIETGLPIIDSEYKYGDGDTAEHWLTTRQAI